MAKKGAVELSISTVVIVVLAVTMLIMGIAMISQIFKTAESLIGQSDDQIREYLMSIYKDDTSTLLMHPHSLEMDVKIGDREQVGFGIVNQLTGPGANDAKFSYKVTVDDVDLQKKCGVTESTVEEWMVTGRESKDLAIAPGMDSMYIGRTMLEIPKGTNPCTFRLKVEVKQDGNNYGTGFMDITLKA